MYSSGRPHLHLISIPMGIRVGVRVRFSCYPNSHGTSCHGNLLFTSHLIDRGSNWYSTHCFKVVSLFHGSVYSTFWSATRPFRELTLELQLSENSNYTSKRRGDCTITQFHLDTIQNYWKSHSYSAFYSYASMKAYRQVKETVNLTSTSLENNVTAALTGKQ